MNKKSESNHLNLNRLDHAVHYVGLFPLSAPIKLAEGWCGEIRQSTHAVPSRSALCSGWCQLLHSARGEAGHRGKDRFRKIQPLSDSFPHDGDPGRGHNCGWHGPPASGPQRYQVCSFCEVCQKFSLRVYLKTKKRKKEKKEELVPCS